MMIDYRGYGRSKGVPSEKGTYQDAMAAWNWLRETKKAEPNSIVVFGRSLGSSIATELATRVRPAGLWIESGFTSVKDVGAIYQPKWLVAILSQYKYPTLDNIKKVKCPVMVVHSPEDKICPYRFGEALFEAAPEPKKFVKIKGGHNDGFDVSGELYAKPIREWLKQVEI